MTALPTASELTELRRYLSAPERDELDRLLLQWQPSTEGHEAELARCASDPVYWINHHAQTYDPRLLPEPALIPFRLFPKQEQFIRWLQEREAQQEGGLAEKSRDVGFTWLCCSYALHGWLFRPGFACGFGSRKLELVDKLGDPDTIFEKIRILLRNLPEWMLPEGFRWPDHDNFCRLINPANGATITGEGGDNIGRGGRKSLYFVDEAAFIERPERVDAALSATTRCRIDVSTPNGPGNPFATKRFSGRVPVFTFHWKDDPRKDDAWYQQQKATLNPVIVAQEIDIDYTASIEGICIPAKWVRAAVGLALPESTAPLEAGADIAEEGGAKTVLIAHRGPHVLLPIAWSQTNTTQTAWKLRDEGRGLGVTCLRYDADGPGMGVKGTWATSEDKLPFQAEPIHGGGSPSETVWPDGRTSKERFLNRRAELWWLLRARFERTYEFKEEGIAHPPEDLISLPDCPELIAQLSQPLVFVTDTGKTKLESKDAMRKRGVKSPDYADALVYAMAPGRPVRVIWAR